MNEKFPASISNIRIPKEKKSVKKGGNNTSALPENRK